MHQSRKFLFYTHCLGGGGAERVFAVLASEFAARGHKVLFAVDFESRENIAYLDPKVSLIQLPKGHFFSTLALRRLIAREAPDVTLSAIGVSNLKHMIAALLSGRMRRAILTYHGFFASEPQFLSSLGNRLTPLLSRLAGRSIAVSDALRKALVEDHGASSTRTLRIHNPVDVQGVPHMLDAAALAERSPVVLFAGRLNADKDIGTLLRAFALVKTPGASLIIAGEGPERPHTKAMITELGISSRVSLAGYLDDLSSVYRQARCLVLTSIRESFGNVIAEALGHGLPVVSTRAAGPVEILDHGRYGTLVPIGDAAAIAAAIDAALIAPGEPAPRMARAAEFGVGRIGDAYLALCAEVMREAGDARQRAGPE